MIDESKRKWHDHELALIAVGLCPYQTGYGLPHTEECKAEALPGSLFCGQHQVDGPVHWYLDASTAHLPPALLENLNSYDGVIAARTKHGWLLWVPDDPDAHAADYSDTDPGDDEDFGVPREVLVIQRFARKLGCDRVLLDSDAEKVPGLPMFEHS